MRLKYYWGNVGALSGTPLLNFSEITGSFFSNTHHEHHEKKTQQKRIKRVTYPTLQRELTFSFQQKVSVHTVPIFIRFYSVSRPALMKLQTI